jgi:triphosphatase
MGSGVETELKFQVPPGRRDAVRRALGTAGVERVRLAARYFDTPDGRLAAAGLALRLRREGRARWVQTLKGRAEGRDEGLMQRLEHEVVLGARERPALDLARHDGTPVGARLRAALGGAMPVERFATDIVRCRRFVRTRGGTGVAVVELAFDEGPVRAGAAERAVCELEFELIDGAPSALLALATRWVARDGLWLDVRSKAEVGHRLASDAAVPATGAEPPLVAARMGPRRALAALVQSCLAQVLPNLAELAAPLGRGAPVESVHQLRVGLRRLRTALREFGRNVDGVDPAWDAALAETFRTLGAQRDRDVIAQTLAPAFAAARTAGLDGVPAPADAAAPGIDLGAALRSRGLHTVLLALIGFVLAAHDTPDPTAAPTLKARARRRLRRLHREVSAQAAGFATLSDEARHRLRRQAKRLRYTLEFVAPLFGRKACARYLGVLRSLQQGLGELNDLALAAAWLEAQAPINAGRAFVRGWVAARREAVAVECATALGALARSERPWA